MDFETILDAVTNCKLIHALHAYTLFRSELTSWSCEMKKRPVGKPTENKYELSIRLIANQGSLDACCAHIGCITLCLTHIIRGFPLTIIGLALLFYNETSPGWTNRRLSASHLMIR
uniref:Uncharacterized protein n=1 Tax=Parascaris equorum TaxID=6256 RepID=A0A914RU33_PAREQ